MQSRRLYLQSSAFVCRVAAFIYRVATFAYRVGRFVYRVEGSTDNTNAVSSYENYLGNTIDYYA
ncbi:MAG: hypothetical protein ABF683_11850 [Sporolactobacillus sp.]